MAEAYKKLSGSLSKFIDFSMEISNGFQLQFKSSYKINSLFTFEKLPKSFEVDIYFILPQQINLSNKNYTIDSFYNDFVSVVRFREPKISYKSNFATDTFYRASSLYSVERYLIESINGERFDTSDRYLEEVHIFGLSFERYIKKIVSKYDLLIKSMIQANQFSKPSRLSKKRDFFRRALKVIKYWRRILTISKSLPYSFLGRFKEDIRSVDEYCLINYSSGILKALNLLENKKNFIDEKSYKILQKKLLAHYRLVNYLMKKEGYITISYGDSFIERENFLFNRGRLKRRISKALYLDLRKNPIFSLQKQFGAMIAAAIAGAWAFSFSMFLGVELTEANSFLRQNTAIIIMALTLAYVLKDRIKELGRDRFRNLFYLLPDHSNQVVFNGDTKNPAPVMLGDITEKCANVTNSSSKFMDTFLQDHGIDLSGRSGEKKTVFKYEQKLFPDKSSLEDLPKSMNTIHTIMRYNIASIIEKLDSPFQSVMVLDQDRVKEVLAPKNYSIGVVIRLRTKSMYSQPKTLKKDYKFRVVINKNGIQRLEKLSGRKAF